MKLPKIKSLIPGIFAFIFVLSFSFNAMAQDGSVVDVINESDDHSIFAELLAETGLEGDIATDGPFTVIAPNNEAFEALGDQLEQIRQDPEMLQNVVIGHLFQGEVASADVEPALGIEVLQGDIAANNGVVHSVGEVLLN